MKRMMLSLLSVLSLVLFGCSARIPNIPSYPFPSASPGSSYVEGEELLALVETEEEAKKIAEVYGIELVSYSYGVAGFHTEEDPQAVISRGKANGWPQLDMNTVSQLHDPPSSAEHPHWTNPAK